jgi:hypothetical protein
MANFGILTSETPTFWHLEIVVKTGNASFAPSNARIAFASADKGVREDES